MSRALLVTSAVAGALSITGALFPGGRLSLQGGLAMLVALAGYVIVAGRAAAPRTRWAFAAGVGMLAVGMAFRLYWYSEPEDFGWFAYAPLDVTGAPERLTDFSRQSIGPLQILAFLHLLAVVCFAAGVFALPAWRRPVRVALAGWRADVAWLVAAGAFLVAVAAATVFDDLASTWSAWWIPPGVHVARSMLIDVGISAVTDGSPQVSAAVRTTVELAGPVLLAIGGLRASRTA